MAKQLMMNFLTTAAINGANSGESGICKSTSIGNVPRSYQSSQSRLRPVRTALHEMDPERYGGIRTKFLENLILPELKRLKCPAETAEALADEFSAAMTAGKTKAKAEADKKQRELKNKPNTTGVETPVEEDGTVLVYLSRGEIAIVAAALKSNGWKMDEKIVLGALKASTPIDIIDIALNGRMFTMDTEISVEGAICASHAYATHKSANDIDYFSAIDDLGTGKSSSHLGTREFTSATYVWTAIINIDQLQRNLPFASEAEIKEICLEVCTALICHGFPKGRKNKTLTNVYPNYAVATIYQGSPCAASYETPVQASAGGGYLDNSIAHLTKEIKRILSFSAVKVIANDVVVTTDGFNRDTLKKVISHV